MLDWLCLSQTAFNRDGDLSLLYRVITNHGLLFETMQFTGRQDKNDKDIYEGDSVKFHYFYMSGSLQGASESEHELTGVIVWREYGWGLAAITGEHWQGYTGYQAGEGDSYIVDLYAMNESSIHEESFEVIGNIYQNPELLQPPASTVTAEENE